MLHTFTKDQLKEIKYQQDTQALKDLASEDPDAIIVYLPREEAIICDHGDDFDYGFTSATEFINWRLDCLDDDLNALADEMGYGEKSPDHKDFIYDLRSYGDDLEQLILDSYSSDRLGDLYDV